MSLIDDLREIAGELPPSHVPTLNELAGVVGALIGHTEFGEEFLTAGKEGSEEVNALFSRADQVAEPAQGLGPTPSAIVPGAVSADQAEIAALKQQVQTLLANQNRTTVTAGSDTGNPPSETATPGSASPKW
jgi:hypothetical protein